MTIGRQRALLPAAAIALVIALSVFFRFYGLEKKLLWHDEMATRVFAAGYTVDEWKDALFTGEIFDVADVQKYQRHNPEKSVGEAIRGLAEDDPQHPPLYYILTRIWVGVFGDGIATLRALSALASLLTLAAVYWLARELFGDRRVAWASVALFGVSPFFVLYAQEAREYALWTAFIVLSNASLLRAIRLTEQREPAAARRPLFGAWATFSLVTVLSLYTSFSSAAVILAQLAYLVIRERARPTRVAVLSFLSYTVSALLFLPWAVMLFQHLEAFRVSMKWSKIIVIPRTALLRILFENFSRTFVDFGIPIDGPRGYLVVTLALALIAWAFVTLVRRAPWRSTLLLLLLVFLPIGMLIVPDLLSGGIRSISMRYLTPAWVGVLLALAFLIGRPHPTKRYGAALPVAVLGIAVVSTALNAGRVAPWIKGTSLNLPTVAATVNAAPAPALVVGNLERHNPGNLMALSILLKPGTRMQFLNTRAEEVYVLPREFGSVFLFTPITEYRIAMQERENVQSTELLRDTFLDLWRVEMPDANSGERL